MEDITPNTFAIIGKSCNATYFRHATCDLIILNNLFVQICYDKGCLSRYDDIHDTDLYHDNFHIWEDDFYREKGPWFYQFPYTEIWS